MMKWLSDLIKQKSLIFVGAELTFLYFLIFGFICFHYVDFSKKLSLNELGDLLAGAFAPLAFMWMVITILMQGKELRLQREELSMQRAELAHSSAQLERQSNLMEEEQYIETQKEQLNEIQDHLIVFNKMFVGKELLSENYNVKIFNGRVTARGFFKHQFFDDVLEILTRQLESAGDESKVDLYGNYYNGINEYIEGYKQIVSYGTDLMELAEEYGQVRIMERNGFAEFLEAFKNILAKYDET